MADAEEQRVLISVSTRASSNGVYFYNRLFSLLGINAVYLSCKTASLNGFCESFNFLGLHAASVAAPFKTAVIPLLDTLSESARATGSVNSVRRRGRTLEGHNTDLVGAQQLLSAAWKPATAPTVLIYGSGGVVPSIVAAVRAVRPRAEIGLVSRNAISGQTLCRTLGLQWLTGSTDRGIDLWINATPTSTGDPEGLLNQCAGAATVFDLVARQEPYPFERAVRSRGQVFIRGFDFYRAQFLAQFNFYFDRDLDAVLFDHLAQTRLAPAATADAQSKITRL